MMNINNFEHCFSYSNDLLGSSLFSHGHVISHKKNGNAFQFLIEGKRKKPYRVNVEITPTGDITTLTCDCSHPVTDQRCAHEFAALLRMNEIYEEEISTESSGGLSDLIRLYQNQAVPEDEVKAHLELEWTFEGSLCYRLKIGTERTYVIKNFDRFIRDFNDNATRSYGKFFSFTHNLKNLDAFSKQLFQLTVEIYYESRYDYRNRYSSSEGFFYPIGSHLEELLEMYLDKTIIIEKTPYKVIKGTPLMSLTVKQRPNGRIQLVVHDLPHFIGRYEHGFFISGQEKTIFITGTDYADSATLFIRFVNQTGKKDIFIAPSDMPVFYNSVLKRVEQFADITYENLPEDVIPPQMLAKLYVDVDENNEILAQLKYCYGDKAFPVFYNESKNPYSDVVEEKMACSKVLKYFDRNEKSHPRKFPFRIVYEHKILEFLSTGISELSKSMEVFVTDSFKKMKVRPSAHPSVGVKTEGNLLALDFDASGYTREELAELLQAYRKGKKYHRFRDGSFALVDDRLSQLDAVTKELNITDKAFLKENISVPMYRMLYLNGLQKDANSMRVKRSADFKSLIKSYQNSLSDEHLTAVPNSLEHILRDYQRTGLQWLTTLGVYRMGGILADDMGLGKTLQAIAFMLSEKTRGREKRQFLVVCPSSLVLNWQEEINRFAPKLKTLCLNGTVAERNAQFKTIDDCDVVITSYATVLRDIAKYEKLQFYAQFLDEAQNIKNHSTQSAKAVKAINSRLRFALTGTPIENTLAELWSIFDFIMPGYLHNYSYFRKTFEQPIVRNSDVEAAKSLQSMTSPFILRRLKKEVLEELPEKTETVLLAQMEDEQRKIYTANAAQVRGELEELDESSDRIKILAMLTRLRQLCCDPSLVYENYTGGSAKLEQCAELVKSCIEAGHKLLLFSQFTSMLAIIEKRLKDEGISFYTLTGQTKAKDRLKMVNEFNENNVSVFLISLKAGGTGLNLTGADIVIHFDPWWNLSAENQASDRAYRIGQRNNVQVYKLIAKGTIEEKIRDLQQKKADLLDTALGGEGDILKMSANEVLSLLE